MVSLYLIEVVEICGRKIKWSTEVYMDLEEERIGVRGKLFGLPWILMGLGLGLVLYISMLLCGYGKL